MRVRENLESVRENLARGEGEKEKEHIEGEKVNLEI